MLGTVSARLRTISRTWYVDLAGLDQLLAPRDDIVGDLPEAGLRVGDLGAVVQVYSPDAAEVEFVTASGRTQALVTVQATDLRPVRDDDLLAVRPARAIRGAA
jgi:hypothetical protein